MAKQQPKKGTLENPHRIQGFLDADDLKVGVSELFIIQTRERNWSGKGWDRWYVESYARDRKDAEKALGILQKRALQETVEAQKVEWRRKHTHDQQTKSNMMLSITRGMTRDEIEKFVERAEAELSRLKQTKVAKMPKFEPQPKKVPVQYRIVARRITVEEI